MPGNQRHLRAGQQLLHHQLLQRPLRRQGAPVQRGRQHPALPPTGQGLRRGSVLPSAHLLQRRLLRGRRKPVPCAGQLPRTELRRQALWPGWLWRGGTCGACPSGQTCNQASGQCQGEMVCNAQSCPTGCGDTAGQCQTGRSLTVCGTGGVACIACLSAPPNATATCASGTCGCTCGFQACVSACCPSNQNCDTGNVCCTFVDSPCTTNTECCAYPVNQCKTVGSDSSCCRPQAEPCLLSTADRCCSGTCSNETDACA